MSGVNTNYITGLNGPFNTSTGVGKSSNAGYQAASIFSQNSQSTDNLSINWLNKDNGSNNFDINSGFAYCYQSDKPLNPDASGTVSVAKTNPNLASALGDQNGNIDLAHQFALCELENVASSGSPVGSITTQGIDKVNQLSLDDPNFVNSTLNSTVQSQNLEGRANFFMQGLNGQTTQNN